MDDSVFFGLSVNEWEGVSGHGHTHDVVLLSKDDSPLSEG